MASLYQSAQYAGESSVSPLLVEFINTKIADTCSHILWNYTTSRQNTQIPTGFIATGLSALAVAPQNLPARKNATAPEPTMDAFMSYNNLALTFAREVKTVGLVSNTAFMGQVINVDSSKSENTLLRIVAQSGATANSTLRTYVVVSPTIYKQIDITLPLANTRYVVDDVRWQNNGNQGAINLPVTINGQSTGTVEAVVTTVGTVLAGAIYRSILTTGTLSAEPISHQLYSNERQKFGVKISDLYCCKVETLFELEKELQDVKCIDSVTGSYTKSKTGMVNVRLQKYNVATEAMFSGSTVSERQVQYRLPTVKAITQLSGANIIVPVTNSIISDVAINCTTLIRTIDNLTSALLLPNNWSYNNTTGQITLPLDIAENTEVEVGYVQVATALTYDPMEITGEYSGRVSWSQNSTNQKAKKINSFAFLSISVENSLEDEGKTLDAGFKVSSTKGLNLVGQINN